MGSRNKSIGRFLDENRSFTFDLSEYVISSKHIPAALQRFADFQNRLRAGAAMSWKEAREELREVASLIPAYATIDCAFESYEETIPLIDKETLRLRPQSYRDPSINLKPIWHRETSGTTGPPVSVPYSPEAFVDFQFFSAAAAAYIFGVLNHCLLTTPVFCVVMVDVKDLPDRVWAVPGDFTGLTVRLSFDERDPSAVDVLVSNLHHHRPAILSLKPNVLRSMIRGIREPIEVDHYLRLIISGGADLDADLRQKAERLLKVPVCDTYGMTEFFGIASECSRQSGLHIYEPSIIAEVLGEDGRLRLVGHGELVVSSISNRAAPLIRYRTGDLVEVVSDPCPCGLPGRRISSISGRMICNIILPDGTEYSPSNLNCLLKMFAVREFRITQTSSNCLTVEIEPLAECTDAAELIVAVRSFLEASLRGLMRIDVQRVTFKTDGKFQRYRIGLF